MPCACTRSVDPAVCSSGCRSLLLTPTADFSHSLLAPTPAAGYYRAAVARKDEFNVKSELLGEAVLKQATKMEDVMQLHGVPGRTKVCS